MEKIEIDYEEKEKPRWTIALLLINMFIWGFILIFAYFFIGLLKVSALTPVEANFTYDNNGTATSYNIRPDGGTTGFIYNNEFFGQEINHSSYRYYKLPGSTLTTTNINGYFQNPCQSNEEMSYTMTINFYKQSTSTNTMSGVSVINGINGCSGYLSQLPDSVVYYNVCTIQPGDVPKFSLYFSESSSGMTTYRVGIPTNFSYTCQVGNQAVIDNATANANNIINNIQQTTDNIIEKTNEAINSANQYCSIIDKNSIKDSGYYLQMNTGQIMDGGDNTGVTDYIKIQNNTISLVNKTTSMGGSYCFYDKDKNMLSCINQRNTEIGEITKPANSYYFRATIDKNLNLPIFNICTSNTQAIIDANGNYFSELNGAINQGLDAEHIHVNPDVQDFEDYEDSEEQLYSLVDSADISNVQVNIDSSASGSFWDLVDRVVHTNTLVFGLLIGALSIGIIKLVLGR